MAGMYWAWRTGSPEAAGLPLILVTFGYAIGNMDKIVHQARINHFDDLPIALQKIASTWGKRG